jgi:nucleoside-diphosphate-sugar epimerase
VDEFIKGDLRDAQFAANALAGMDEVYQLAADMGGAGYLFSGENDAAVMHNSALINLNVLEACVEVGIRKVFYSSSACIYPEHNQRNSNSPNCAEDSAYPAAPDSEYGWEKLFSERVYAAYMRNHGIQVRIARLHNVFGKEGTWYGGREKAPAAICRKVALAKRHGTIDIWGDGKQTRSFLHIHECIEGMLRLMESSYSTPLNIGSDEMISITGLAQAIIAISGKDLTIRHTPGFVGVRGRTSDNALIKATLGWSPTRPLVEGLQETYHWIRDQVEAHANPKVLPSITVLQRTD